MNRPVLAPFLRRASLALLLAAGGAAAWAQPASAPAAQTVRPDVAKPLQAAQELLKAGNPREAQARAAEAEAVLGLTPWEAYLVQRVKAAAAIGAGDRPAARQAVEAALRSGQTPPAEQLGLVTVVAQLAYEAKDYAGAVPWLRRYVAEGGTDAAVRALLPQALYLAGDAAGAAAVLAPQVQADEAASRATPEITLRLLAAAQAQAKDDAGYLRTLERLAVLHGKPDYWHELIARRLPGNAVGDRLRLDWYRLRQAAGSVKEPAEWTEMAQLALQAGLPAEARSAMDEAAKAGTLSAEQQKLRQQATQAADRDRPTLAEGETSARAAKDGDPLVNLGFAFVTDGQVDKGLGLMSQGVAKGGLKRPEEARLHLGIAQFRAGRADEAQASFAAVQGADGATELARLWALYARSMKK